MKRVFAAMIVAAAMSGCVHSNTKGAIGKIWAEAVVLKYGEDQFIGEDGMGTVFMNQKVFAAELERGGAGPNGGTRFTVFSPTQFAADNPLREVGLRVVFLIDEEVYRSSVISLEALEKISPKKESGEQARSGNGG